MSLCLGWNTKNPRPRRPIHRNRTEQSRGPDVALVILVDTDDIRSAFNKASDESILCAGNAKEQESILQRGWRDNDSEEPEPRHISAFSKEDYAAIVHGHKTHRDRRCCGRRSKYPKRCSQGIPSLESDRPDARSLRCQDKRVDWKVFSPLGGQRNR